MLLLLPLAYAEFSKGGRKFENNEDQKWNFSTQNQSVFLPKIRWRPKKRSSSRFCPFVCSNFLLKLKRGAMPQFCVRFYANYTILAIQRGGHGTMPPLNTPRVVAHIHLPVTGQRQTIAVGRFAHFLLHWLLRDWRNPHLRRSFQWSNVPADFFEYLPTEFAACSKPPSRDNHRKAFYPRHNNVTRVGVEPRSCDQGCC